MDLQGAARWPLWAGSSLCLPLAWFVLEDRALKIGSRVTVRVNVDHGQFIACDPQAALDLDSYDARASRDGLALWGGHGGVTVFTASHWPRRAL